jgi:hypothetical protein
VLVKARGKNPTVSHRSGTNVFRHDSFASCWDTLEGNPLKFHWTLMSVVAMFYLAIVGSVLAFLLYYWLVHNMDVTSQC